jgi:hypothetical protein
VHEFLRRFLQHVPAKGFHRVRAFGLLHPEHRDRLRQLQLLLAPRRPLTENSAASPAMALRCPHCHQPALRLVRRLSALECRDRERLALATLPSNARAPPSTANAVLAGTQP